MEAQGSFPRRSVQGLRHFPRSSDAGAGNPSCWRHGHLRHGRPIAAADLAVHTAVRQAHCRLAAGRCAVAHQGHSHHQPAEDLPGGVCPLQAVPTREAQESYRVPRHRSCFAAQVHFGQVSATELRRNEHSGANRR